MHVWKDVLIDLWQFLLAELFGRSVPSPIVPEQTLSDLVDSITVSSTADNSTTVVSTEAAQVDSTSFSIDQMVYVTYPDTPCYLRPALVIDTLIGRFSYAKPLRVVGERDDWIHVKGDALEGWTERSHLTKQISTVLPQFVVGTLYDADHPETLKLRTYINDEFGASLLHKPLMNCEYVWYHLLQRNQEFGWPPVRPRSPGRWQEILRTESSVLVSETPLTGSVMEYTDESSIAQLFNVKSVTPDGSVVVDGFTGVHDGLFEERVFKKDEWSTYKPKFLVKK